MIDKINKMLQLLDEYRHPKNTLMEFYVSTRLNKSYELYDKELSYSMNYLKCKHEKSLLKRMTKLDDKVD